MIFKIGNWAYYRAEAIVSIRALKYSNSDEVFIEIRLVDGSTERYEGADFAQVIRAWEEALGEGRAPKEGVFR